MTFLYVLHVFALMTQSYAASTVADNFRSTSLIYHILKAFLLTSCRRLFLGDLWRCHSGCHNPRLRAGMAQFSCKWVEYF